jgi:hypothetical protein
VHVPNEEVKSSGWVAAAALGWTAKRWPAMSPRRYCTGLAVAGSASSSGTKCRGCCPPRAAGGRAGCCRSRAGHWRDGHDRRRRGGPRGDGGGGREDVWMLDGLAPRARRCRPYEGLPAAGDRVSAARSGGASTRAARGHPLGVARRAADRVCGGGRSTGDGNDEGEARRSIEEEGSDDEVPARSTGDDARGHADFAGGART